MGTPMASECDAPFIVDCNVLDWPIDGDKSLSERARHFVASFDAHKFRTRFVSRHHRRGVLRIVDDVEYCLFFVRWSKESLTGSASRCRPTVTLPTCSIGWAERALTATVPSGRAVRLPLALSRRATHRRPVALTSMSIPIGTY